MELTNATCLTVLPRSATPLKAPLLVIGGNRFRCLRLVADQPKPMPWVPVCAFSCAVVWLLLSLLLSLLFSLLLGEALIVVRNMLLSGVCSPVHTRACVGLLRMFGCVH